MLSANNLADTKYNVSPSDSLYLYITIILMITHTDIFVRLLHKEAGSQTLQTWVKWRMQDTFTSC